MEMNYIVFDNYSYKVLSVHEDLEEAKWSAQWHTKRAKRYGNPIDIYILTNDNIEF